MAQFLVPPAAAAISAPDYGLEPRSAHAARRAITVSRFASIARGQAWVVVTLLVAILLANLIPRTTPPAPLETPRSAATAANKPERDEDIDLYQRITHRLERGDAYYPATADALRNGNYPLRPFVTFRLPTLAFVQAALGPILTQVALWLLMLGVVLVWYRKLDGAFARPGRRLSAILLLVNGMTIAMQPHYVVLHEIWAGLLIALSLGLHSSSRWWPSVVVGLLAVCVRELALPYLLLMGAFALGYRRWGEAIGWGSAIALFGVAMFAHAAHVAPVVLAGDPPSPGWLVVGGWSAFLRTMIETSVLRIFPTSLAPLVVVFALFGWMSWPTRTGLTVTLLFAGYGLAFMIAGRPQNFYWGLVVSPLLLVGLAFLPSAFLDLRMALLDRSPRWR